MPVHRPRRWRYATATPPKKSVGAKQFKSNAVSSAKVKDSSLLARDFKTGQLGGTAAGWEIYTKIESDGGQLGPGDVGFSILVP